MSDNNLETDFIEQPPFSLFDGAASDTPTEAPASEEPAAETEEAEETTVETVAPQKSDEDEAESEETPEAEEPHLPGADCPTEDVSEESDTSSEGGDNYTSNDDDDTRTDVDAEFQPEDPAADESDDDYSATEDDGTKTDVDSEFQPEDDKSGDDAGTKIDVPEDLHPTDPVTTDDVNGEEAPDDAGTKIDVPEDLHPTDPVTTDDVNGEEVPDDTGTKIDVPKDTHPVDTVTTDDIGDDGRTEADDASENDTSPVDESIEEAADAEEDNEPEEIEELAATTDDEENVLIVIDDAVDNSEQLEEIAAEHPNATVIVARQDETLEELAVRISEEANEELPFTQLEVFAHRMNIGSESYGAKGSISDDSKAWSSIASNLTADADILWWGCDVADDEAQLQQINDLAEITGKEVLASDDSTGVGGDWVLEYSTEQGLLAGAAAAQNTSALNGEALAEADVALAFTNGGTIQTWTTVRPAGGGDVEITFNELLRSQNLEAVSFQDAENFAHAHNIVRDGEVISNGHLYEYRDQAEYNDFLNAMGPKGNATWDQFSGAITAIYDTGTYDGVVAFNDDQGSRFGDRVGGSVATPDNSTGANFAPWDEVDGSIANPVERAVVITGGTFDFGGGNFGNAPADRIGEFHTVRDGVERTATNNQSAFEPNALIVQASVIVGDPSITGDAAAIDLECRVGDAPVTFLNDVNISTGENTYVQSIATTITNDAGATVSFNSSLASIGANLAFDHTITANVVTITAVPGFEPTAAQANSYLNAFTITETSDGSIPADKTITGSVSVTTADIFGQGVTFTESANYSVAVDVDCTDANDDGVAVGNTSYQTSEDTTLNISAANGLLSNDTDLNGDTLTVTNVTQPSAGGTLNVNPNGSFSYTPPPNFSGPVSFTYDVSDGDRGSDSARVTINIEPANDTPDVSLSVTDALSEESGSEQPFDNFTLTDVDSTPGAVTVDFSAGWVQGDRDIDVTGLQAANPNVNITHDATTGNVTISNGGSATTADFQDAVRGISISVADNQPDLTTLEGVVTVFDSQDADENPITDLNAILANTENTAVGFEVDVLDRLEVSGGAEGAGINTGHEDVTTAIQTTEFNDEFSQADLDNAQGVYIENADPINPFDDATFEQRDGGIESITLDVQSGWVAGESQWNIDSAALNTANITVTAGTEGDLTFTPTAGNDFDAAALSTALQNGAILFEAAGETVTASTITAVFSGQDSNNLTETASDTVNNVDADADGVVTIIQVGDNDDPVIDIDPDPTGSLPDQIASLTEEAGFDTPFEGFNLSDIDSTVGAVTVEFNSGWVDGDREVDITSLQANNPNVTIAHDATTGSLTITNAGSATNGDFETAVRDINVKVADNQPDLTPLVGQIEVFDSVNSIGVPLTDPADILTNAESDSADFSIEVIDRLEVSGGDEGAGNNTGHENITPEIQTDAFNAEFPQSELDDAQGVYLESTGAINPFDDAAFESRDGNLESITLDVQSGWVDGESQWNVDEAAFDAVNITVTETAGGNLSFTPTTGDSFSPDDLAATLQGGGVTFEATGEDVTHSRISAVFSGQDTNDLTETATDTVNNVDADADGVVTIIQIGLNDGPVIDVDPDPEGELPNQIGSLTEESGAEQPFSSFSLTDIDSLPGAITVDFSDGWVEGDRTIDIDNLQADNPALTITHDTATGNVTFSNAGTATTEDFERAVQGISISVADNQPDLTPIVGEITVFDSVDSIGTPITDLADILANDEQATTDFSIEVIDRLEVSGGAAGAGENTGHDAIPDQIKTEAFDEQFPQSAIDDAQGVYVENEAPINPFDDAAFESRDGELTEITLDVQSGWIDGESTWVIDDAAFADVNIQVTEGEGGDLTFTPVNGESFSHEDLNTVMQAGGVSFEAQGESVTASTITAVFDGGDTNGLTETGSDTANNVDADGDGVITIIQLGVNDAPEVTLGEDGGEGDGKEQPAVVVVEGGKTVTPLADIVITDVDSENLQSATIAISANDLDIGFSAESRALMEENNLTLTITEEGFEITGEASVETYEQILAGLTLTNPDDDVDRDTTTKVEILVTVNDVSETGFNDDLTGELEVLAAEVDTLDPVEEIPDPVDPMDPTPVPVEPEEPVVARHIHVEEEEEPKISLEEVVAKIENPDGLHIHYLVQDMENHLESQTRDLSDSHVSNATSGALRDLAEELNPETPPSLENQLSSTDHAKQTQYLIEGLDRDSIAIEI